MKKITTIPMKKISFKNVPITGIFFYKRTLYKKISLKDAIYYNIEKTAINSSIYFDPEKIIKFISKQHEYIAIDLCCDQKYENEVPCINDTVQIIKKNVYGKVVSVNKSSCLVQYKNKDSICYDEFLFDQLKK